MLSYASKYNNVVVNNPVFPSHTIKVAIPLELSRMDLPFPGKVSHYCEPNIKHLKDNINTVRNLFFGSINITIFHT